MTEDQNNSNADLIKVGVVVSAHGIRGQVKVKSFTADPLDMLAYGPLLDENGHAMPDLTIVGEQANALIAKVGGASTREQAEALKGTRYYVPKANLPEPEEDEFYQGDLVGLAVQTEQSVTYGIVRGVYDFGAGDVIEIEHEGMREMFIFDRKTFPVVDLAQRMLVIILPDVVTVPMEITDRIDAKS